MKPFRLKDRVTGLYYCPSRSVRIRGEHGELTWVKSNLSKKGKIYWTDPRKHIDSVYDHSNATVNNAEHIQNHQLRKFVWDEWELEEVKSS